jgi:hypothetical protein
MVAAVLTLVEALSAWPCPPFDAYVAVNAAIIHRRPSRRAPITGFAERGGRLRVTGCEPSCADDGWALLGNDGAVPLDQLSPSPADGELSPSDEEIIYATVRPGGLRQFRVPDLRSRPGKREDAGRVLAFRPDMDLFQQGWLERRSGGFVRVERVRLAKPSQLVGEHDPPDALAFVRTDTTLYPEGGPPLAPVALLKHERLPAYGLAGTYARVAGGLVERSAVRLAFHRKRPRGVGALDRWVHVDVNEQVLTAYEGDRLVFAALISTGKSLTPTDQGIFRVVEKAAQSTMEHEEDERTNAYYIEAVPDVLAFTDDQTLHGAFWHDRFGFAVSHGCINLSPADAAWLFAWAPPALPAGWHTIYPGSDQPSLFVRVERSRLAEFPPGPPAASLENAPSG